METTLEWADAMGYLNWLADLNGLGVLASLEGLLSKLSMYLSVPFKFAKYVFLGTISLAFGAGTLLVIRRS